MSFWHFNSLSGEKGNTLVSQKRMQKYGKFFIYANILVKKGCFLCFLAYLCYIEVAKMGEAVHKTTKLNKTCAITFLSTNYTNYTKFRRARFLQQRNGENREGISWSTKGTEGTELWKTIKRFWSRGEGDINRPNRSARAERKHMQKDNTDR